MLFPVTVPKEELFETVKPSTEPSAAGSAIGKTVWLPPSTTGEFRSVKMEWFPDVIAAWSELIGRSAVKLELVAFPTMVGEE